MRLRNKIGLAAGIGLACLGLTLSTSAPAHATGVTYVCAQAGNGYCLNNWGNGGSGNPVKMETYGATNDHFQLTTVNACNGTDRIQSSCVSAWGGNSSLVGAVIVEVQYQLNANLCVATAGSGYAVMGACGDGSGNGAANGVIMATTADSNCNAGFLQYLVDRYWSHANGRNTLLLSGGAIGNQALFSTTDGSCWGWRS